MSKRLEVIRGYIDIVCRNRHRDYPLEVRERASQAMFAVPPPHADKMNAAYEAVLDAHDAALGLAPLPTTADLIRRIQERYA